MLCCVPKTAANEEGAMTHPFVRRSKNLQQTALAQSGVERGRAMSPELKQVPGGLAMKEKWEQPFYMPEGVIFKVRVTIQDLYSKEHKRRLGIRGYYG